MDPDRDYSIAINYGCEFCGAPAGERCINDRGAMMELPHYARTPDVPQKA